MASAQVRAEHTEEKERVRDTFGNIQELKDGTDRINLPNDVHIITRESYVCFLKMDCSGMPEIQYSICIRDDALNCEVYWNKKKLQLSDIFSASENITSFYSLEEALHFLDGKPDDTSVDEKVSRIIDELKDLEISNDKKLGFVCEQLNLMTKKPHSRSYSQDLLAMACMWESVSPATYEQIQRDNVLTLPSAKYVRRLSSAITVDYNVSESTESTERKT